MSVVEIEVGTVGLILDPGKHAESRGIFQRGQRDTVRGIILHSAGLFPGYRTRLSCFRN